MPLAARRLLGHGEGFVCDHGDITDLRGESDGKCRTCCYLYRPRRRYWKVPRWDLPRRLELQPGRFVMNSDTSAALQPYAPSARVWPGAFGRYLDSDETDSGQDES